MAPSPEMQAQILGFVVYSIPLVVALWKVFSWLDGLEDRLERSIREVDQRLTELSYQSQLKTQQLEALNDKVVLAVNGSKEVISHVRSRSREDNDKLQARVDQIERFLVKTSEFEARK